VTFYFSFYFFLKFQYLGIQFSVTSFIMRDMFDTISYKFLFLFLFFNPPQKMWDSKVFFFFFFIIIHFFFPNTKFEINYAFIQSFKMFIYLNANTWKNYPTPETQQFITWTYLEKFLTCKTNIYVVSSSSAPHGNM
jgi:hypothetical protein